MTAFGTANKNFIPSEDKFDFDTDELVPNDHSLAVTIAGEKFMDIIRTTVPGLLPLRNIRPSNLMLVGCNRIETTSPIYDIVHGRKADLKALSVEVHLIFQSKPICI